MRKIFCFLLLLMTISLSAQQKLAYYSADSLLPVMPGYSQYIHAVSDYKHSMDSTYKEIQKVYLEEDEKLKKDSASLTAVEFESRKKLVLELMWNAAAFSEAMSLELVKVDSVLKASLLIQLQEIAKGVAKQEKIKLTAEEKQARQMAADPLVSYELVDITQLVREELQERSAK